MNKKILITGGAGNVGGALARNLVKDDNLEITILDNLSTGSKLKLPDSSYKNWDFVNSDVNNFDDMSVVMTSKKFDYVFHYAAVVGVKRTQDNPIMVLNDIEGIRNVLQLSKNSSVKRVFFSSSSEVYGEPVELPQNEETTPLKLPSPVSQAIALKATIPIIMFPLICIFSITIIDINAPAPKRSKGFERSPSVTRVTGWSAVSPIISKPITPKNKPIPAPIPSFKLFGIEFINQALIGVNEIIKKTTPATNTAPSASAGVYCMPKQTPYAMNALIPIPGARPTGQVLA